MRVATKIVTLTATLVALLILVLVLQLWWVQRLAAVTESLPATTFRVGSANLALSRSLLELRDTSLKLDVSGAGYLTAWRALRDAARQRVRTLAALDLSPGEREVVTSVQRRWQHYSSLQPLLVEGQPLPLEESPIAVHLSSLDGMRTDLHALSEATDAFLAQSRRDAGRTVSATKRVAWLAVAAVCLVALPILWWTIRSIHRPLRRLTAGTRDVAAGRFSLQLDESSGDELAEVAASFNRMVRRLRELDELKRDFLSHVSHELNTPLVAMRETNELLLDGLVGPLAGEQRRMLELNRDGAVRLSGMIRKILDLSRLEAGAMEYDFSTHELGALLQQGVDEFSAAAQERGIELALALPECEVAVHCDRDRLLQVINNLLANALKFGPAGSRVELALEPPPQGRVGSGWRRSRDNGRAMVRVTDQGPGVAIEQQERIFDKFHRGSRKGSHGFGLGLAISREIIEAHGGRVFVERSSPEGSVFGVELAASRGAARADTESAEPEARRAEVESEGARATSGGSS